MGYSYPLAEQRITKVNMKIKLKNCKACGGKYEPWNTTQQACSTVCAIAWSKVMEARKADRERRKIVKANRKALMELNKKNLKWQHKLTQTSFNRMRVLEEKQWFLEKGIEPKCISCGRENMDWCCGHLKTVGSQGNLRYDRINTYLQCNKHCNSSLSGNINGDKHSDGYLSGLALRFGAGEAKFIINHCETSTQIKKWTWCELEDMRKDFNTQIRLLEELNI